MRSCCDMQFIPKECRYRGNFRKGSVISLSSFRLGGPRDRQLSQEAVRVHERSFTSGKMLEKTRNCCRQGTAIEKLMGCAYLVYVCIVRDELRSVLEAGTRGFPIAASALKQAPMQPRLVIAPVQICRLLQQLCCLLHQPSTFVKGLNFKRGKIPMETVMKTDSTSRLHCNRG